MTDNTITVDNFKDLYKCKWGTRDNDEQYILYMDI